MTEDKPEEKPRPSISADQERFLLELLDTPAPSSFEEPAARLWKAQAEKYGLTTHDDRIGTAFATANRGSKGPRIALVGHLDEIGLIITKIDSKGFLKVTSIGGWDPVVLPGQRVRIITDNGFVYGSISRTAVHALSADELQKAPKVEALSVDIGVENADEARELVRVGDPIVMDVTPRSVGKTGSTRLMSRCIDNRVGAFIALEVARIVHEKKLNAEVVAVGSVGEEIGMGGATAAVYGVAPDRTCVIDVTTPGDTPGASDLGDLALGDGPILTRGASLTETATGELIAAAKTRDLPHQLRAKGVRTATDADQTVKAAGGMATCLVSVPARYLHTPVEQVDLRDIQTSIDVIVAWIEDLAKKDQ